MVKVHRLLKRILAGIIPAVLVLSLIPGLGRVTPAPAGETGRPKVIMVIVNRVALEDITDPGYQNIRRLISRGGLGLMTINSGGDFTDINSYVSLGGGDKFIGSVLAGDGYNREETLPDGSLAQEAYRRNTGKDPGASRVLNVSIAATLKVNQKRYTVSTPGQLGSVLHEAGLKTAVIGNSDLSPEEGPNRLAVTVAMDDAGRVDDGNVSRDLLQTDPKSPYGRRTDYGKLKAELARVYGTSDFIVVETGDTFRVNGSSDQQLKRMTESHRHMALQEVDEFIGSLPGREEQNTMIMVVAPLPHAQALRDGVRLTPVIIAGGPVTGGSVLTSPSTREKGLVANYDVTATVAAHLGVNRPAGLIGLPVQGLPAGPSGQTGFVTDQFNSLTANFRQRAGVLLYFTRYQWLVYSLILLQVVFRFLRRTEPARFLLTGVLLYPLAILLVPLTGAVHPWLAIFWSLVFTAVITYLITRLRDNLKLYSAIALILVIPTVVDVLTGAGLMKKAALGYDLVVGGRFYGIGNEYMGVLIGAAILGSAALLQLLPAAKRRLLPGLGLILLSLVVFFAAPSAGTNAGGALAAMLGFATAIYKFTGRKIKWRSGLLLIMVLAGGVGILVAANYLFSFGAPSHIGRAVNDLFRGNFAAIWQTVLRKLVANFYLLRHSPFSTILVFQLLLGGALFYRNRAQLAALNEQMPFFRGGLAGMLAGALAAFTFNDSGVIAAALLLNYLIGPLVLQVLRLAQEERAV